MGCTAAATDGNAQAAGTSGYGMGTTGAQRCRIMHLIIGGLGRCTMNISYRLMQLMSVILALGLVGTTPSFAQSLDPNSRGTRPLLKDSTIRKDGDVIIVTTDKGLFPEPAKSPFVEPPG